MEQKTRISHARFIVVTAILSAVSYILMLLDFSVPFMPGFIKLDVSELPALIGAFALGPVCGVAVCLVKNLLHLLVTTTGGVGELSNFLLGAVFTFTAGLIYMKNRTKKGALLGSLIGAAFMAVLSVPINYFITYPFYMNLMPLEKIIAAYQAIFGGVNSLLSCLVVFNLPFTFLKGLLDAGLTALIYKRLSPIIKGK
ncbi:MAG: ECF transporter S component [Oscillospiraceae bacterium]|nr:ECF transporter S component [Oscillospiraceae bacterium]